MRAWWLIWHQLMEETKGDGRRLEADELGHEMLSSAPSIRNTRKQRS